MSVREPNSRILERWFGNWLYGIFRKDLRVAAINILKLHHEFVLIYPWRGNYDSAICGIQRRNAAQL
jgi:hypothetical protein